MLLYDSRGCFGNMLPEPMINNVLILAKLIHEDYNRNRLKERPDVLLDYSTWEDLPADLKYSNIRQAQMIPEKLALIDCYIGFDSDDHGCWEIPSLLRNGLDEILEGGAFAGGPDSLFVELCMEVRKGSGEECLDGILSRYAPECLENPDIRFLMGSVKGCWDESYPKVAVSHNNTSE